MLHLLLDLLYHTNRSENYQFEKLSINPKSDGTLSMDATAKTFRYLDPDEVATQRKAGGKK